MEAEEITRNTAGPKHRRLPEIPEDQEPFDVTKAPRKPPRLHRCSTPDLSRPSSSSFSFYQRSSSLTESRLFSSSVGGESTLSKGSGNLGRRNSAFDKQVSTTVKLNPVTAFLSAYCDENAVYNRRCTTCHQRIFPQREQYLIAQSMLFHTTCFRCAVCTTCVDVTDYCYVTEHDKFYCLRHYHDMVASRKRTGNERKVLTGTGPGAFAGIVSRRRKRKETLKALTELQHRRTKLAEISFHVEEAMTRRKDEERAYLWKHWLDVTYESIIIARVVTELAYQLKEVELCDEQELFQRKLRSIRRKKKKGNEEDIAKEEGSILREIRSVIEKRDLLLLELEIERKRDYNETKRLKSIIQDRPKAVLAQKNDGSVSCCSQEHYSISESQNGQCIIL